MGPKRLSVSLQHLPRIPIHGELGSNHCSDTGPPDKIDRNIGFPQRAYDTDVRKAACASASEPNVSA